MKAPAEGLRGEANAGVSTFGTVIRETPDVKVLKHGIYSKSRKKPATNGQRKNDDKHNRNEDTVRQHLSQWGPRVVPWIGGGIQDCESVGRKSEKQVVLHL